MDQNNPHRQADPSQASKLAPSSKSRQKEVWGIQTFKGREHLTESSRYQDKFLNRYLTIKISCQRKRMILSARLATRPGTFEAMKLLRENYSSQPQNPKQKLKLSWLRWALSIMDWRIRLNPPLKAYPLKFPTPTNRTSRRRHEPNKEQVKTWSRKGFLSGKYQILPSWRHNPLRPWHL